MRHSTFFLCKSWLLFLPLPFCSQPRREHLPSPEFISKALTGFDVLMESLIAEESPSVLKVFFISLSGAID